MGYSYDTITEWTQPTIIQGTIYCTSNGSVTTSGNFAHINPATDNYYTCCRSSPAKNLTCVSEIAIYLHGVSLTGTIAIRVALTDGTNSELLASYSYSPSNVNSDISIPTAWRSKTSAYLLVSCAADSGYLIVGGQWKDVTNAPTAAFSGTPTSGTAPLEVTFTDSSTATCPSTISGYLWDFGDDETSSDQNPVHTYEIVGLQTVSLDVTSSGGTDTETKTDYITVNGINCDFSADKRTGDPGTEITFTSDVDWYPGGLGINRVWKVNDESSPSGSDWEFKTGSTYQSINPVIIFNDAGDYTITLEAEDTTTTYSDSETKTDYIQIARYPSYNDIRTRFGIINGTTILKERRS